MIDLEELERLEKAATSGPWETRLGDEFGKTDMLIMAPENPEPNAIEVVVRNKNPFDYIDPEYKANFDLIVALRNAAPELIAELRQARQALCDLVQAIARDMMHNDDESMDTLIDLKACIERAQSLYIQDCGDG